MLFYNSYFINRQIYTGKIGNATDKNSRERVVWDLSKMFLDKGRNITTYDFF